MVTLVVDIVVAVVVVGCLMTLPRSSLALRNNSAVFSAWSLDSSELSPSLELSGSGLSIWVPLDPAVGVPPCSGPEEKLIGIIVRNGIFSPYSPYRVNISWIFWSFCIGLVVVIKNYG